MISSPALSIHATPFRRSEDGERDEGRRGGEGEGERGCKRRTEWRAERQKQRHPPLSDVRSKGLTLQLPRYSPKNWHLCIPLGIDVLLFSPRSICFSFYPGLAIERKLLSDRNSKRNGAMIPVCMYARFSKRVAFKYFTIGREKCEFRAKDLSMIRPSRRKETIEVFLIMFFE